MKHLPFKIPQFPKTDSLRRLAIAVDTSGSMQTSVIVELVSLAVQRIINSLIESGRFKLTVWAFDNSVMPMSVQTFSDYNHENINERIKTLFKNGCGGSSFDESYHFIKALNLEIDTLIFITDGYMNEPKDETLALFPTLDTKMIRIDDFEGKRLKFEFCRDVYPLLYVTENPVVEEKA